VRLTYCGSACRGSAVAGVDEDSTRVVITGPRTVPATSRDDVGVPYDVEVRLGAPLLDKELVDGAWQMSKYANQSVCGPKTSTV